MRTWFEPDEDEEFEAAKALLVRRCLTWAGERRLPVEGVIVDAALESRHRSRDGRLCFWNARQVRRFLLEWIPHHVVASREVLDAAPDSLTTMFRYLAEAGLRDPRGATPAELEAAVDATAAEYPAVLDDPDRQSVATFWTRTALDHGVDLTDGKAVARFRRDVDAGRVDYDADLLDRLVMARFFESGPDEERAFPQPPVTLPPPAALTAAAARSEVVRQLVALADWTGSGGRALTGTGNLRLTDARELAAMLGTGEQDLRARSAAELPKVGLLFAWAKAARLVRVSKGRLLRVAKAAPLLREPERLWSRAFESFFDLGAAIGASRSPLARLFDEIVDDALNSVYGMPAPMPVARLTEPILLACEDYLGFDDGVWREQVRQGLDSTFEALAALGAVELSHGLADELYSSDLDIDDHDLPPDARARLRARLAEPGPLVQLTPLGVRAVRDRLLAEGRDAPLVGELAGAAPAELLGMLAQHYPQEQAEEELRRWLAANGGSVEPLLDAVRACPFRSRAAALLDTLVQLHADGRAMLPRLRDDRVLGPIALTALVDAGKVRPEQLSPREQLSLMAEGLLNLLELGGPQQVVAQLAEVAGREASEIVAAVANSDHPADVAMAEFRSLVSVPARAPRHRLRMPDGHAPGSRGSRSRRGGRGRRRG